MITEEQERRLIAIRPCEEDAAAESTEPLNNVECTVHQHQNRNDSNLDIGVHHRDLSHHSHHHLDNNSDPASALFPHHQHIQPHRHDLNGDSASTDVTHTSGSDLLQQHLLTHNPLHAVNRHHQQPHLHHPEHQHHHQYQRQLQQRHHLHNLNHQSQQQQHQHTFSYHHEHHACRDDDNDPIVEAASVLPHDVSVVDVVGLHQHPHSTDITPVSEHHQHNHHMNPSRLMQQEDEHQISLAMVYPPHQYNEQYQQPQHLEQHQQHRDREDEEQPSPSVDPTQTSVGIMNSIFPARNSPLISPPCRQPQKLKNLNTTSAENHESTRSNKIIRKGGSNTSKISEKKRPLKRKGSRTNEGITDERESVGIVKFKKPRRRRYDNNFKAEVLNYLKGPQKKLPDVARRYGIPENTLREWTKADVVRAIETARSKNSGQLKANMYDPMRRLSETLTVFFEHNKRQPEHLRQSITTKLVVAKVRLKFLFVDSSVVSSTNLSSRGRTLLRENFSIQQMFKSNQR